MAYKEGVRLNLKLFLFFTFLFSKLLSQDIIDLPSYYVYSLDGNSLINHNDSNKWGTSKYTANYKYFADYRFNASKGADANQDLEPMPLNATVNFDLGDESYGLMIKYLKVFRNGIELSLGREVTIKSQISDNIIPQNYFDYEYTNNRILQGAGSQTTLVDCLYKNPGPNFNRKQVTDVKYESIVNFNNRNFGLRKGEPGIFLLTSVDDIIESEKIDDYVRKESDGQIDMNTNNITFTVLFLIKDLSDVNFRNFKVAALTNDNKIYFFKITDDSFYQINISKSDVIDYSQYNITEITKVEIYNNDKILIGSRVNGLTILKWSVEKWAVEKTIMKYNNQTLAINDMVLVDDTVYMIVTLYGLVPYSVSQDKFGEVFLHPRLITVDYTWSYTYTLFLGVLVDNLPSEGIPEIYLEFAYNYADPLKLLIHKVFISERNIDVKDIASDSQIGVTYFLDPVQNKMFILSRAVANDMVTYNLVIDFKNFRSWKSTSPTLSMLSVNDIFFPSLLIEDSGDFILFSKLAYTSSTLNCKLLAEGDYKFTYSAYMDCSKPESVQGRSDFTTCWNNSTTRVKVDAALANIAIDDGDKTGLWVVLAILIVAVIAVIVSVLCCKVCRKSQAPGGNVRYMPQKGEVIEVQIMDNKL